MNVINGVAKLGNAVGNAVGNALPFGKGTTISKEDAVENHPEFMGVFRISSYIVLHKGISLIDLGSVVGTR